MAYSFTQYSSGRGRGRHAMGRDLRRSVLSAGASKAPLITTVRRRTILGLAVALLAAPRATAAQPAGKVYRVGCIPAGPLAPRAHQWDAFRQTLRELGWVEG